MMENTWLSETQKRYAVSYERMIKKFLEETFSEKEATTMRVTYNGFTGELVKLEATYLSKSEDIDSAYNLVIFDRGKRVEYSFTGVNPKDVKFLDGVVAFGE